MDVDYLDCQGTFSVLCDPALYGAGETVLRYRVWREEGSRWDPKEALDFVREVEEKQTSSFLYSVYTATQVPTVYDQARTAQFEVIQELAAKGSCVIVGRAADCILFNNPNCVRVFIHAPMKERIRRATEDYKEVYDNPERALNKKDKARAAFYNNYSERPWGDTRNYHLTLDSSIGLEQAADIICAYTMAKFGK